MGGCLPCLHSCISVSTSLKKEVVIILTKSFFVNDQYNAGCNRTYIGINNRKCLCTVHLKSRDDVIHIFSFLIQSMHIIQVSGDN